MMTLPAIPDNQRDYVHNFRQKVKLTYLIGK